MLKYFVYLQNWRLKFSKWWVYLISYYLTKFSLTPDDRVVFCHFINLRIIFVYHCCGSDYEILNSDLLICMIFIFIRQIYIFISSRLFFLKQERMTTEWICEWKGGGKEISPFILISLSLSSLTLSSLPSLLLSSSLS